MVVGLSVIFGWFLNIGFLKSILPNMVAMKFTTAMCFVASGIILYSVIKEKEGDSFILQTITPSLILFIVLIMATLLVYSLFGVSSGIDSLFIKEKAGAINTVAPGRPSMATMINFILIALAGMAVFADSRRQKKYLTIFGASVMGTGAVAVLGYIISVPALYYNFPGINTAIALNTSVLFIFMGIGLILCGKIASK